MPKANKKLATCFVCPRVAFLRGAVGGVGGAEHEPLQLGCPENVKWEIIRITRPD